MGARVSTILKYDTLKEDEVNLCDMQESSPDYRNNRTSKTVQYLRTLGSSFTVRIHPHIVIGCSLAVVLVLIITLTAVYKSNRSSNGLSSKNVEGACDADLSNFEYLSQPYKHSDFQVDKNSSVEISGSMNIAIDPCDNFYQYACEGWAEQYPRPENISNWDVFMHLSEQTDKIVTELMDAPSQQHDIPSYKLAKNFYKSCIQVEEEDKQRDEKVLNFVWDSLEKYGGWPILYKNGTWNSTNFNWMKSMTDLERRFKTPTILNIYSFQDMNGKLYNNSIFIDVPSSFSGKPEYQRRAGYLTASDSWPGIRTSEVDFIVNASKILMKFKGQQEFDDEALREQANAIIEMQDDLNREILKSTLLSTASQLLIMVGLQEKNENKMTLDELQYEIDGFQNEENPIKFRDILELLYTPVGVNISEKENLTVTDIDYVLKTLNYIQEADAQTLANFLHYKMLVYMMPMLTTDFRELLENRNEEMGRMKQSVPRKEICAQGVEESFRFAVGQKFVKRQFKSMCEFNDVVIQMKQMFYHIRDMLYLHRDSINSFLDESNLETLINATDICVGFPEWLFDSEKVQTQYTGLQLENLTTYVEQTLATNEWALNKQLVKLRQQKIVGECEWEWFPGEVGAFTYLEQFKLYFPLGILQKPFLRQGQSLALNYGAMGTAIGHELTHAFARFGWEKSEDGSLMTGANCLVEQYDKFTLKDAFPKRKISKDDNISLSGSKTVNENFADNGGISLAYKAFKVEESKGDDAGHAHGSLLSSIGQRRYTNDQLFFIGFAQIFCESDTVKGMKNQMELSAHSPGTFRVLGTLQNSEEFSKAWNCSVGSKMNLDDEKCSLFEIEDDEVMPTYLDEC